MIDVYNFEKTSSPFIDKKGKWNRQFWNKNFLQNLLFVFAKAAADLSTT